MNDLVTALLNRPDLFFSGFIFVSAALMTIAAANIVGGAISLRRRTYAAGRIKDKSDATGLSKESSGPLSGLLPSSEVSRSELRKFLSLAGFNGIAAPAIYQLIRILLSLCMGISTAILIGRVFSRFNFPLSIALGMLFALSGYYLPRSFVSIRRDKVIQEHRNGFPDFLDLLVICSDAGVGIASAIDRTSKDLVLKYPSLARNLATTSLELRAGRSLKEALDNLSHRLGIDEARSFATLLQQSEELGSSLVQSLRVYSEEMRQKRYARAEEKAHALPAKLVIPLALFIFPVILAVTLLPAALKIYKALGIH
jgi:tight adherence protein C